MMSVAPRPAVTKPSQFARPGEHLIGSFIGDAAGPTLIAVGSLHGNEPAGASALKNVAAILSSVRDKIRGRIYFYTGNTRALSLSIRFLNTDLNRYWTAANLSAIGTGSLPDISEAKELAELDTDLRRILSTARDEVYVLDLHSTSATGIPFTTVGDTLRNREFARGFPVTILLGIEEQLEGTMLEYLNNQGAVTLGFEGGQHDSPETVRNHEALIWLALVSAGIIDPSQVPAFESSRRLAALRGVKKIFEVRHRHPVTPDMEFAMDPGFNNFEPVKRGQVLARDRNGPIKAPESGVILMPLYQKLGEDGFFIGRRIAPFWLGVSLLLRRLKVPAVIHWLPGVRRDPTEPETIVVDTTIARLFPLQIFHLLGFRKRRWSSGKLVVSRRKHDTSSPFRRGISHG